jgi:hypothetical protein
VYAGCSGRGHVHTWASSMKGHIQLEKPWNLEFFRVSGSQSLKVSSQEGLQWSSTTDLDTWSKCMSYFMSGWILLSTWYMFMVVWGFSLERLLVVWNLLYKSYV